MIRNRENYWYKFPWIILLELYVTKGNFKVDGIHPNLISGRAGLTELHLLSRALFHAQFYTLTISRQQPLNRSNDANPYLLSLKKHMAHSSSRVRNLSRFLDWLLNLAACSSIKPQIQSSKINSWIITLLEIRKMFSYNQKWRKEFYVKYLKVKRHFN